MRRPDPWSEARERRAAASWSRGLEAAEAAAREVKPR